MNKKKIFRKFHVKSISIFIILFVFLGALVGRLFYIMVINGPKYKVLDTQQITKTLTISAKRGEILDRNGKGLAESMDIYRVDADVDALTKTLSFKKMSFNSLSEQLSKILKMNISDVTKILKTKDSDGNPIRFVSLKRYIEKDEADSIKSLKLNGLMVNSDIKRYYPNGSNFLSQTIGNINMNGTGITGVELSYNKELSGTPGKNVAEQDKDGNDLPYTEPINVNPIDGNNIILTIDENVQEVAEQTAEQALSTYKAKSVSIIVMNPKNGEILALVNKPDYDPNSTLNSYSQQAWKNSAVENIFEPGSIFKVITAAAALTYNAVNNSTKFLCTASIKVANRILYNDDKKAHGVENLSEIIQTSNNVGFVELCQNLGKGNLLKFCDLMGFGKNTGIDLPGESSGIVKNVNTMTNLDLATMSYGQGVSVTQVQYMAAFNAIANGGTWIRPHIMKEIQNQDNNKLIKTYDDYGEKTVMSKETAAQLRIYLERVVTAGTGIATYIKGYHIAGKTGTAESFDTANGGYGKNQYISSFAGMVPANNPVATILVTIDRPDQSNYYAAGTAVPTAKNLLLNSFDDLSIRPDSSK